MLSRLGKKTILSKKIIPHFPKHEIWIEPFFGAGGMFFNKPLSKYNLVNDLDKDVSNLFIQVMTNKNELYDSFKRMPIHKDLLDYWSKNIPEDKLLKALRFLLVSNFTYLGKQDTLHFVPNRKKETFYNSIDRIFSLLEHVVFNSEDFRRFFKSLSLPKKDFGKPSKSKGKSFVYADPPYLDTTSTYDSNTWSKQDVIDLFACLNNLGIRYAYSEYNNEFVLDTASDLNLNIINIGEKRSIKNKNLDILITNYKPTQLELFQIPDMQLAS